MDKDWKPFVQNRVEKIRRLVPSRCWRHCPGKDNPADIPSRGLTPDELHLSQLWRSGAEWLEFGAEGQPLTPGDDVHDQCMVELKASNRPTLPHALITNQTSGVALIIECERFSNIHKLYRVTALVLKFIQLVKKRVTSPELARQDITSTEEMWIRESQKGLQLEEKFPVWKAQFGLFQDERKLWRCGGRLQNADLPYSAKHPILLNRKHYLATLVVRDAHRRVQHDGVRETLTGVRSKFWLIRGRSLIRAIIHECKICKRFEEPPISPPEPPPLLAFQVRESPPFTHTAVDYAGPLYVRLKDTSQKVWISLFTCCVSRAIHLELVFDMSTAAFLRCVKRFAGRRGFPQRFLSDNAKTFKGAAVRILMPRATTQVEVLSGASIWRRPPGGAACLSRWSSQQRDAYAR